MKKVIHWIRVSTLCTFVLISLLFGQANGQTESSSPIITTESLLREMADRDALARFPEPAFRALQASSYDRASEDPAGPAWTANRDFSQFVREETRNGKTEYVLLDDEGPGAVVRIWMTWAGRFGKPFSNGTMRLYIDDMSEPIFEAPATEFIDGGPEGNGLFGQAPLAYGVSMQTPHSRRGHNLFAPIPYAKRCKITYQTDLEEDDTGRIKESLYYHIGYRKYDPTVRVESFSVDRWNALKSVRQQVASQLNGETATANVDVVSEKSIELKPGERFSKKLPAGSRVIRSIALDASKLSAQSLRSTILELSFDGKRTVQAPVEGFFASGYRPKPFQTWMNGCTPGLGLESRWTMPYEQTARIELWNVSDQTVVIPALTIQTSEWSWDDRSLYFHANWQTDRGLSTGITKTQDRRDGVKDLDFLDANGRGVLVGDSMTLYSGAARWWGEGDEKIFVDDEQFPSHFGTGTEDYYGYAWCRPETFSKPFHAQPVGRGALLGGLVVNTRIRSLDAIPFRKSIDFDMELWHWSKTKVNYARTVFWYGDAAAKASGSNIEFASRPVALRDTDVTQAVNFKDAVEGESARVVSVSGGSVEEDRYTLFGWSGGSQLLWKDAKPGDKLVLEFSKWPAKSCDLIYTIGPDYGEAKLTVEDDSSKTIKGRFIGILSVLENRSLSVERKSNEGPVRITVEMQGQGTQGRRFGLDAIVPSKSQSK
ncbi:MAG: glycoside hydrolase family 172 protein [Planctomycetota bacterium]